ncbi:uncharacterized protein LOC105381783 [Plutella xylostella]|uniref:uncharacterized protein LOC105381783 n=1 Tax=Plutella xylostella TaxID=51655 RepID=UPI0020331973|nr:uncharacterized protein LOC105381783 [Plutella xylostella]
MEGKKQIRSNNAQLAKLADIMSQDHMLANGEFTGPLGARLMEAKWQEVRDVLKEIGPDKSIVQWKQTWRDLKRKARKENAAANTARNATGNIIEVPSVSNVALRVLDATGQDCSVGIGPEETNIGREVIVATDEPIITIETEMALHDYAESSPLRTTRVRRRQRSGQPRQQQPPVAFLNMQQEHNNLLQHQNVLLNRLNDTVEGNSYTGNVFKIRAERRRNTFGRKWW